MHVGGVSSAGERMLFRSGVGSRLVDRFHALSPHLANELIREFAAPANRVAVVRSGVDTERFVPDIRDEARALIGLERGVLVIGVCARLELEKDIDLAVRGFAEFASRQPSARLVVVGDGSQRGALEILANSLGVAERVHFLGQRADVHRVMPAFDLYLQTTRGPNLGFSALEALSCGVPLIICARDRNEEVMASDTLVDGSCGCIVPATPVSIGQNLHDTCSNPVRLATMQQSARRVAERHYAWRVHVNAMKNLYAEIADHHGCR
jgi:glycosyltransferase involved in cell wall biosynthesis